MSVVRNTRTRISDPHGEGRARIVARFRDAWQRGDAPALDDFLPLHTPDRSAILVDLVRVDFAHRRQAGEVLHLEAYLLRYPELAETDDFRLLGHQNDLPLEQKKTQVDAPEPPRHAEPGRPFLPGYEILGELGRGGMGVVYKARQLGLNRIVALKMILAGAQAAAGDRERFRVEAEASARLQHPNIVQVYEIGEHLGRPYFSLEYCPGGSLENTLAGRPFAPAAAAALVETLAGAIHHAHLQGIVHRDLKPANVLLIARGLTNVAKPQEAIVPKITDFGLAKRIDEVGLTRTGAVLGTPPYMAPEQARGRGRDIGPGTDVYALGAILFECLTGRPPFDADSVAATLHQVLYDDPPPPSRFQPKVPCDLDTIVLKCLQKDPRRRYASALDLADDLHRFGHGEPIHARPAPAWAKAARWARRRPAAALGILSVVVALAATVGGLAWHARQLEAAVEAARRSEKLALETALTSQSRAVGQDLLAEARDAFAHKHWTDAQDKVNQALAALGDRLDLRDLIDQATSLQDEVRSLMTEEAEQVDAIARCENFLHLRDDALFHGLIFSGAEQADNLQTARQSAQQALDLWNVDEGFTGPLIIPSPRIAERRKDEIKNDCYELLVVLAGALAQPPAKGDEAGYRARLGEAMTMLDRAARVGLPSTKAYHLRRARVLDELGRGVEAEGERRLAQESEPANALDYFLAGDELRSRKEWPAAAAAFEQALRFAPDHFWAQYGLACCHLRLTRFEEAKLGLTACLGHRRGLAWLYTLRALANIELNDFAAAEDDLAQADRRHPTPAANYAIRANRGVLRFRQAQALDPPRLLERAAAVDLGLWPTVIALKTCQQQCLAEAAEELAKAESLRPRDPHAHASLALVRAKQDRVAESRREFDEAIRLAPGVAALYRSRAEFLAHQREPGAALLDLRKAVELEGLNGLPPVLAEDHVQIGRLMQQGGDSAGALEAYAVALRHLPDYPKALRLKAVALLESRRYEEAARSLDRYLELAGKAGPLSEPTAAQADAHRLRGLTRTHLGDYPGALNDHTRALALHPDAATYGYRAWVFLMQGAAQSSLRDFDASLKLDPANGDARVGRAQARLKMGQVREAVQDAEAALDASAPSPRLLLNAASVLAQAGSDDSGRTRATSEQRQAWMKRSLSLVAAALAKAPAEERVKFWQEQVGRDPLLEPLRRLPEFQQLAPRGGR